MDISSILKNEMIQGKIEQITRYQTPVEIKEKVDQFEQYLVANKVEGNDRVKTLEQWIQSLEELKYQLENDITKDNLNLYKESVKRFLDYYVNNDLYLKEYKTKTGLFYSKKIQVIKAADEKIDRLTDDLISSQMGRLEILELTGEIQGLLFNLLI